jgi:diguanylate cyclase (GGDEF)-like protein
MAQHRPAASASAERGERLGLYRILASFPLLESYRAKLYAVVGAAFAVPLFLTLLAIVLGAGRMSVLALFVLFTSLILLGCGFAWWALDRLLEPFDATARALDAQVEGRALARLEIPGSDVAARVLRGVQALLARLEAVDAEKQRGSERDPLTGLFNRTAGRRAAQSFAEDAFKRGRSVRIVVADIDRFAELNASQGPISGDLVLKTYGARLAKAAGADGLALRWDGDRFVLVQAAAEGDFRPVDDILARAIVVKGRDLPVTLSVGVAEASERAGFDAILGRAEAALRAVREGRE